MKALTISLLAVLVIPVAYAEDPRLAESRQIVADLQKQLGGRLVSAMEAGGPVEAISVCNEHAPGIAGAMSKQSGAEVSRTALKLRNPGNAPDEAKIQIMKEFSSTLASGGKAPEHFQVYAEGGALYMKAIVLQEKCLGCHGSQLAPEVTDTIAQHYPEDQATGFKVGDLRGAFVVQWPR